MSSQDHERAELAYLVTLLGEQRRKAQRVILVEDFLARATRYVPDDAGYLNLLTQAALVLPTRDGAALLDHWLQRSRRSGRPHESDLLLVTVKPVEHDAVLAALGRAHDAAGAGDDSGSAGRVYFDGHLDSAVAGRPLSYRVATVTYQGNRRAGLEMAEVLEECSAPLTVLIGMAAATGFAGDVVSCEQVIDANPGTRRDGSTVREAVSLNPPRGVTTQVMANRAHLNGWHEQLEEAARAAEEAGLTVPRRGRPDPEFSTGVIVSHEQKDETTTMQEWLEAFSGDAKAYDMESAGFGDACGRSSNVTDWTVFRGIADGGAEMVDGRPARPKDLQMWATLSAATCFLTWVTTQATLFGTAGEG